MGAFTASRSWRTWRSSWAKHSLRWGKGTPRSSALSIAAPCSVYLAAAPWNLWEACERSRNVIENTRGCGIVTTGIQAGTEMTNRDSRSHLGRPLVLPLALTLAVVALASRRGWAQFGATVSDQVGAPANQVTAIRAGRLFDSSQGTVLTDQVIVVRGARVVQVGPGGQVQVPAGAQIVDLSRATVLPGLIDAHEHIFLTGESGGRYDEQLLKESWQYRTIEALLNARRDLMAGFTSMRDCETEGAMYSDVDVKRAINRGLVPGPRLEVATRALSTTGGYPLEDYSPEVTVPSGVQIIDGPEEGVKAVREQIKYGADFIKVYGTHHFRFSADGKLVSQATFSPAELAAIVGEAHADGVRVACHAYGGAGLHNCIDAGVDSIEHGLDLDDEAIAAMRKRGTWLVPTLYVYEYEPQEDLGATGGKTSRARIHEVSFRRALAAHLKIAFGTDAGP